MKIAGRLSGTFPPPVWAVAALALIGFPASAQNPVGASALTNTAPACPGDDSGLTLPPGFCATIFADDIGHARHMVVAPNGVLYVNTWSGRNNGMAAPHAGGFLVALQDTAGSGKANVNERFGDSVQTGGAGGTGIGWYKGALYAEINDRIVRYTLVAESIVPKDPPEVIVSGLPLTGDHPMHPFAIDADGFIYIDVASATNACQEKNRALESPGVKPCKELETRGGIWRYDAKTTNQSFSPAGRYATGIRNADGIAIDSTGHGLYATQHGRDQLADNWPKLYTREQGATLPAEELLRIEKGGDYGWPRCYYDQAQEKLVLAPEYGGDGGKTVGVCAGKTGPIAAFAAHWAPDDLALYDGTQFPIRYRQGAFIAFHGSWNRAPFAQDGYNVVFQPLANGHAAGQCEIFAAGFAGPGKAWGKAAQRPTGLAFAPDGALYISDDVHGRIYRVVYRGGDGNGAAKAVPCPDPSASPGEIIAMQAAPPEGTQTDAGGVATADLPLAPGSTREMVALGDRIYYG